MRRLVDVVVATLALIFFAPVILTIAVAIGLSMGQPVLFRQRRAGLHGSEFMIVKFRTMREPRYPEEPDAARTTRVGAFLRSFSLDELPQLVNVLKGDMSLIGPRPPMAHQIAYYTRRQRRRLEVRPGITGYAQVNGRNSLSWPERIELDIWYIDHRSVGLDARIVAKTLKQLLRPDGISGDGGVNPDFPIPADSSGRIER